MDVVVVADAKGSRFEARSIAIAKSSSSITHCWNHSWQASPNPYTIATRVKLHAMRDTVVGIRFAYFWTGFLGLHYTWVKASLQGLTISDSKVTRAL